MREYRRGDSEGRLLRSALTVPAGRGLMITSLKSGRGFGPPSNWASHVDLEANHAVARPRERGGCVSLFVRVFVAAFVFVRSGPRWHARRADPTTAAVGAPPVSLRVTVAAAAAGARRVTRRRPRRCSTPAARSLIGPRRDAVVCACLLCAGHRV